MADIKPFRALTYNQEIIKDYSRVACPPYDVISAQEQERYHAACPNNFIRILLGKDTPGEDKYRRAASIFKEWQEKQILVRDPAPAIYFYSQEYKVRAGMKTRLGFIARLGLDDKNSAIHGHENTHLGAKADRLKLLQQVKANLSPIFGVFLDKKKIIGRVYQSFAQDRKPFIEMVDEAKVRHKLWRIDSPSLIGQIESALAKEDIFIADGHHRYEVACAWRQMQKEKLGPAFTGKEDFNYVLAYFTNTDERSLTILPIHRLVRLAAGFDFDGFLSALGEYFRVEEVKDKTRFFFVLEKGSHSEHLLGMYRNKRYWILGLKNAAILDKMMPDKPKAYRLLDVSILNAIVFKDILGLDTHNKEILTFSPDAQELIKKAGADLQSMAFILNPVKMEQVVEVALAKEKMPQKSTYFYPKVLSGLVVNKLS